MKVWRIGYRPIAALPAIVAILEAVSSADGHKVSRQASGLRWRPTIDPVSQ